VTRPRLSAVGLVAAALLVVAGTTQPAPASPSASSATPADYPSCGLYWNRATPVTPAQQRANRCIVRASAAGKRARLVAALTTVEGDPVVNYVFVRGRRDILVVVDATRDQFGSRRWEQWRCTSLALHSGHLFWHGCSSVGAGKPTWLRPARLPG
jgi:hypothetical protein